MGYQTKNKTGQLNTPAYIILSPNDTSSSLNSIDFSNVGNSISSDSGALSKIHRLSKISSNNTAVSFTNDNLVFSKINNLYLSNNSINQDSYQYGSARQHNHSSLNSFLPAFSTLVDNNSFKNFFDNKKENYNDSANNLESVVMNHVSMSESNNYSNYFFKKFLLNFKSISSYNATTDGKNNANPLLAYYSS